MSSMNELFDYLKKAFSAQEILEVSTRQYKIIFPNNQTIAALTYLKENGYSHLSLLTCVDWIDDKKFEITYILFNWNNAVTLQVSTFIERDEAKFVTVKHIWPTAEFYERDVHDFFGVVFEGNQNCTKPFILENWDDLPPLRKDFDPLKYSQEHYGERVYEKDAIKEAKIIRGDTNG